MILVEEFGDGQGCDRTDTGYVGLAVHTVARVCSVGHGEQIVVTSRTKAATDLAGVRFRSLGTHHLAGLGKPETLHQVVAEGLRSRFPALRTLAPSPISGS